MDKIQKFLVTAGRKDLAQEYYEKVAINEDIKKIKRELINSFDKDALKEFKPIINKIKNLVDVKRFTNSIGWGTADIERFLKARNITATIDVLKDKKIGDGSRIGKMLFWIKDIKNEGGKKTYIIEDQDTKVKYEMNPDGHYKKIAEKQEYRHTQAPESVGKVPSNKIKMDKQQIHDIMNTVFPMGKHQDKFTNLDGHYYEHDDGQFGKVTGLIDKEYLEYAYGNDARIGNFSKIEKELDQNYNGGPGRAFSQKIVKLFPKNNQVGFEISFKSGMDI